MESQRNSPSKRNVRNNILMAYREVLNSGVATTILSQAIPYVIPSFIRTNAARTDPDTEQRIKEFQSDPSRVVGGMIGFLGGVVLGGVGIASQGLIYTYLEDTYNLHLWALPVATNILSAVYETLRAYKEHGRRQLVKAFQAIDEKAKLSVRSCLNNPLVDISELELHLEPRKFDDIDPQMIKSHNYSGLGLRLFNQSVEREQAGDLEVASKLKFHGYELMSFNTALNAVGDLTRTKKRNTKEKLLNLVRRALENMYYPAP